MAIKLLEAREQKENKAGNTRTKAISDILRDRDHKNRQNTFREQGNRAQRNVSGEQGKIAPI